MWVKKKMQIKLIFINSLRENLKLKKENFLSLQEPYQLFVNSYTTICIYTEKLIQINHIFSYSVRLKYCVTFILFVDMIILSYKRSYNTFNNVLENVYLGHAAFVNKVYNNT